MSRRQRTILILSVRIPVKPAMTQKETVEAVKLILQNAATVGTPEILVTLEKRETHYL